MNNGSTVIGLDVHKETVVAAVLPPDAERARETVTIENHPKAVERLVTRLAARGPVAFVYEAGPCGYEVQRLHDRLTATGDEPRAKTPSEPLRIVTGS